MRMLPRRFLLATAALLAPAATYAASSVVAVAPGEASQQIMLGSGETRITLTGQADLGALIGSLGRNERVYLVLGGLHATTPPGVVYDVYLALPAAADHSLQAGSLNFFAATDLAPDRPLRSYPTVSLDVTEALRTLATRASLGSRVDVIVVPVGVPASNPAIAKASLVVQ